MSRARKKTPCRNCGGREWYTDSRGSRVCKPCHRGRVNKRRRALQRDPAYRLWRNAQERARVVGVPFALTVADVRAVMTKACPIFNKRWGPGRWSASLDRLRPERGYVPDNIAVISMRANLIKSDATSADVGLVFNWMKARGL